MTIKIISFIKAKLNLIINLFFIILTLSCSNHIEFDDSKIFRYNESKNITSLDPAFARNLQNLWPIQQMFNSLVQLDDSLNVKPELAKKWNISSDGLTYEFTIRDDVFFHKSIHFGDSLTRRVVASDMTYSFNRLKDKNIGSPGGWVLKNVKDYGAKNDSTFIIILKKPFPAFLSLLSMRYCSVVPKEVADFYKEDFRNNPIGTGPFKLKNWKENVKLVLRKNNNYFEKDSLGKKLPLLESISISFLPDIQSEFMLFTQGKLDFINSIDSSYKDDLLTPNGLLQKKYKSDIKMLKGPYLNTEYIGFYLKSNSNSIKSDLIREAMNIGFDRKKMILYLRNNIGFPALQGFIPKGLPGHKTLKSIKYEPEKAKRLVKKFVKNNKILPKITLATDAGYVDLCEFFQREMEKIGIEIKIEILPTATLRQAKSNGKVESFRASWIADYPDAENYLSLFSSTNHSPFGPNYTHFKNQLFDSLYDKSFETINLKNRNKIYEEMNSIIMENLPVIPLYYDQTTRFVRKNVKNFPLNPINLIKLKKVYKDKIE